MASGQHKCGVAPICVLLALSVVVGLGRLESCLCCLCLWFGCRVSGLVVGEPVGLLMPDFSCFAPEGTYGLRLS